MILTDTFTIVRLPVREQCAPAWSQSAEFVSDKVILQSGLYAPLFGASLAAQAGGHPWKRGIVTIRVVNGGSTRSIRRVFAGSGALTITQREIGLDGAACSALGVEWGQAYTVQMSGGSSALGRGYDRFLQYWNHPADAVRASFKLGFVGLLYAVKDDTVRVVRWISAHLPG